MKSAVAFSDLNCFQRVVYTKTKMNNYSIMSKIYTWKCLQRFIIGTKKQQLCWHYPKFCRKAHFAGAPNINNSLVYI